MIAVMKVRSGYTLLEAETLLSRSEAFSEAMPSKLNRTKLPEQQMTRLRAKRSATRNPHRISEHRQRDDKIGLWRSGQ
jgi:hypothetical protein